MGSPSIPAPPTPGEAATAQTGTTEANTILNTASAPLTAYADVVSQLALDPQFQALASSMQNRSALQNAAGQRSILQQVNPQAFANQNMLSNMSANRLGQALGVDPRFAAQGIPGSGVFNPPDTSMMPNPNLFESLANSIAKGLPRILMDKKGNVTGISGGQNMPSLTSLETALGGTPGQIPTEMNFPGANSFAMPSMGTSPTPGWNPSAISF